MISTSREAPARSNTFRRRPHWVAWLGRRIAHLSEAYKYRRLILDWAPIARGYVGLEDLRSGRTIRLSSGLRFEIAHAADAWTLIQVIGRNDYRVQAAEPWRTVVDIGANLGTFAVVAARAAPQARIYCYEPSSETCELLRRNLSANGVEGRAFVHECAVSGVSGSATLISTPQSSMRRLAIGPVPSGCPSSSVNAVTLESIFTSQSIERCDFLKMDCEGAEYEILWRCPEEILQRVDRLAVEYHVWTPDQNPEELKRLLRHRGFCVDEIRDPLHQTGYVFAQRDSTAARSTSASASD